MTAPDKPPQLDRRTRQAIAGLAVTQMVGWGTTFHMPAILGMPIARELAMPREIVFAGISVMLIVASPVSTWVGKRIDARGGRGVMATGSALAGAGLFACAFAAGPVSWLIAWVLIGLALPMMVNVGAFASLAHLAGQAARRAIGTLMLFGGFAATIFWPLGSAIESAYGWRTTLLVYGAIHFLVCLPIHLAVIRANLAPKATGAETATAPRDGELPPERRGRAFVLLALVLTGQGFLGWGLSLHFIDMFEAAGVATGVAIAIGAMHGPTQIGARFVDWATGSRIDPLHLGLAAAALLPFSALAMMLVPSPVIGSLLLVVLYGMGSGLMSIARSTIPLSLFGAAQYGAYLGRLTTPQNLVFAVSPIAFAAMLARGGYQTILWFVLVLALATLVAMVALLRYCRGERRVQQQ